MDHRQIVRTVIDPLGAYAFFDDETAALTYAARVHGQIGPLMTRQQAHELVEQQNEQHKGGDGDVARD